PRVLRGLLERLEEAAPAEAAGTEVAEGSFAHERLPHLLRRVQLRLGLGLQEAVIEQARLPDGRLHGGVGTGDLSPTGWHLQAKRAQEVRAHGDGATDAREDIEGEQRADARLEGAAMLLLDAAEVVGIEEVAAGGRAVEEHHVSLPRRRGSTQRGMEPEQRSNLTADAAAEALAPTADRRAFRADVMEGAVGKGEEERELRL